MKINFIDAEKIDAENIDEIINGNHGILVPGGFGERAIQGKLDAITYARQNKVPYLGICLGMQLAIIEYTRKALGYTEAGSSEFDNVKMPIIDLNYSEKEIVKKMRLGLFPCKLQDGTKIKEAYNQDLIYERHRHRYEFNNDFLDLYKNSDLVFSGINPELEIIEAIELKNHPWFVACQFHPEFLSRPTRPHPLFLGFIKACMNKK